MCLCVFAVQCVVIIVVVVLLVASMLASMRWLLCGDKMKFRIVSHSCSAFPSSTLFPDALSVILEFRLLRLLLLLLYLPVTLFVTLGGGPWCCESFEKYSSTVLKSHSISAISRHCCVGDDCKMVSSARIAILDPALLTILYITPNLDCISNVSHSTGF